MCKLTLHVNDNICDWRGTARCAHLQPLPLSAHSLRCLVIIRTETCMTPATRVWTPLTSSPSPQVMSPRPRLLRDLSRAPRAAPGLAADDATLKRHAPSLRDPVSTEAQKHRSGLCSTINKNSCRMPSKNQSTRISSNSSRRRATTSSRTTIAANFGIS